VNVVDLNSTEKVGLRKLFRYMFEVYSTIRVKNFNRRDYQWRNVLSTDHDTRPQEAEGEGRREKKASQKGAKEKRRCGGEGAKKGSRVVGSEMHWRQMPQQIVGKNISSCRLKETDRRQLKCCEIDRRNIPC
jgi:hypothetical protein